MFLVGGQPRGFASDLEGENIEPRNHTEVADIAGADGVAEVQCRHSDQQIGSCDDETHFLHFGVDLSGKDRHLPSERFDGQDVHYFI